LPPGEFDTKDSQKESSSVMTSDATNSHDLDATAGDRKELQRIIQHLAPAEKLQLIEEVARSLREPTKESEWEVRRANIGRLRRELGELPVCNPIDGFSNRDHDDVLYGEQA